MQAAAFLAEDTRSHRRADRPGHGGQHLPLWHLRTHPRGDPRGREGSLIMPRRFATRSPGVPYRGGRGRSGAGRRRERLLPGGRGPPRRRRASPRSRSRRWRMYGSTTPAPLRWSAIARRWGRGSAPRWPWSIADELEADWDRVVVEQAPGDEKTYGSQNTDGSTSIRDFLPQYRETGATVRLLLEAAARPALERAHGRGGGPAARSGARPERTEGRVRQAGGDREGSAAAAEGPAQAQGPVAVPLRRQGDPDRRSLRHDHGAGDVRPGPPA